MARFLYAIHRYIELYCIICIYVYFQSLLQIYCLACSVRAVKLFRFRCQAVSPCLCPYSNFVGFFFLHFNNTIILWFPILALWNSAQIAVLVTSALWIQLASHKTEYSVQLTLRVIDRLLSGFIPLTRV